MLRVMTDHLKPRAPVPLAGNEALGRDGVRVRDFWSWAFSDLRDNTVRGELAEFLVARAVEDPSPIRRSWDDWDVTAPDGTRIEVKCSAYLQSWHQRRLSRIVFSGLKARTWDEKTGQFSPEPVYKADVYLFAVQTTTLPEEYDMTDIDSWRFYVLPVAALRTLDCRSISLERVQELGFQPFRYVDLADEVARVASRGDKDFER